ncbi:MAG: hypothetical protein DME22_12645 [Verrucomicrobia bacterium]|nr:MAG: hypothetical protein DME22_12645 [Verrucomicrobiota bacterium]PYJ98649.1 MAG: hypothetical protein DME23_11480 [Verrucomicrobiota bacterium]
MTLAALCGLCLSSARAQQSPWLPVEHQFVISPAYSFETFDKFWFGKTKMSLKPDDSIQHTAYLDAEYGLSANLALDLTAGYMWAESKAFNPAHVTENDAGWLDTTFGVRYRLVDEHNTSSLFTPTLTLRVGGIIEGTYQPNYLFSAGAGASGVETSLLFGKTVGQTGLAIYGDVGYRHRGEHVPDNFFSRIGVSEAILICLTINVSYRHAQSLSGGDIGAVPFPQTKQNVEQIEAGIGFTDKRNRAFQIFVAETLDGRNVAQKSIVGISASFPF